MKVINFVLAVIVVLAVVHVEPNLGGRVMNMKEQVMSPVSLDIKGPVTPSGPSTCTHIPGSGGKHCPPVKEINVEGENAGEANYPHLVVPFGVATKQN